jgi:hypothetical protein
MTRLRRALLLIAAAVLAGGVSACAGVQADTVGHAAAHASAAAAGSAATVGIATAAKTAAASPPTGKAAGSGKHASILTGVSCAGTECVAVGYWYNSPPNSHTLAELWDGKSWILQKSPDGPADSMLTGVGCSETSPVTPGAKQSIDCVAVGDLMLHLNLYGHWGILTKSAHLTAATCAASPCLGVGEKSNGAVPVYAYWTGYKLLQGQLQPPPHAAQAVTLAGDSCMASNYCFAVGDYSYGVGARPTAGARDKTLVELMVLTNSNTVKWIVRPTPNVSHWNQLSAISCAWPDTCTAVGVSEGRFGFAERWNGKTNAWTVQSMPSLSDPAKPGNFTLSGVSCPTATFCVAVGNLNGSDPFVETWNGARWRLTMLPLTDADNGPVTGVSCASASSCVAVGFAGKTYAFVYSHGHWRLTSPVNPG